MTKPRIMVVEDHALVGAGILAMLNDSFDVIGPITDGTEVVDRIACDTPDLVLLDLALPGRHGLELIPEIARARPECRVLVLSMHSEGTVVQAAMSRGATGFVPKDVQREELLLAIGEALAGRVHVSPRLEADSRGQVPQSLQHFWRRLTPRQREILLAIGIGRTTEEIARQLGLSHHTIYFHRQNIRRVLGIESDDGLAHLAAMFQMERGGGGGWEPERCRVTPGNWKSRCSAPHRRPQRVRSERRPWAAFRVRPHAVTAPPHRPGRE